MEYFNPHSNDWLLNKFEIYKELRNRDTAYYSEKYGLHIITRYDDVVYALNNPSIFSSSKGNLIIESPKRFGETLGASDEPVHGMYKDIVKNAYNKESMKRIADCFSTHAKELLDTSDIINISNIIEQLSAWVAAEVINLPYDKTVIKDLIVEIQRHSPQCVSENVDASSYNKLLDIINKLLYSNIPPTGQGIYQEFINNNPDQVKTKTKSLFTGPAISGASSLTGVLEFLTLDMYRENQLETVYNDRSLIPQLVNESLRFHASTGRFSRTVVEDITLHGIDLKVGDRVALCLESANRDPLRFPDPDKFILDRNTAGHVAFGYGIHACIALAISKNLMQLWVEILLESYGKYKVVTDHCDLKYVMTASGNDDMISNIKISSDLKDGYSGITQKNT
jgi:cytochrome P450